MHIYLNRHHFVFFLFFANIFFAKSQNTIYHSTWIDFNKNGKMDIFENPKMPTDLRIKNLLSQMTVDEKTCQLATLYGYGRVLKDKLPTDQWKNEIWKDGIANIDEQLNGIKGHRLFIPNEHTFPFRNHPLALNTIQKWFIEKTRMGIPVDFTNEGIHGLTHEKATPLPAPIAIGSTWNRQLIEQAGRIVGKEGKALGYTNIYAPILDLARDPRWGRTIECYGEDPYLVGELGVQMTRGIQSQGVAATLKHYAVYSVPKGGRDGRARTDPHVAPREMHDLYLSPFEKVIKQAHPKGVMSSYNDYDGVPVTASAYFLQALLRKKYGFTGYIVSDSEAVEFVQTKHRTADTYKEAVRQCIEGGLNVRTHFTPPSDYILPARELVKEGKISMKTLDARVADVLRVKFELGLFDNPYTKEPKLADSIVGADKYRDFILEMARQSLILLKNKNNFLPLSLGSKQNIFITGPLASATDYTISRYGPTNLPIVSILEGIRKYSGEKANIQYHTGCDIKDATWPESEIIPSPLTNPERSKMDSALNIAKKSDVIVAVMGEDEFTVGESLSRTSLDLPGRQQKYLEELYATGKPVLLVLVNGRPLTINWANRYVDGILETWFGNNEVGTAVAEVIFGSYNPGGKLTTTFPKSIGQIEYNFPFKPGSHANQPSEGPNGYGKSSVNDALYPFGYGLSYTKFDYKNIKFDKYKTKKKGKISVSFELSNVGTRDGDEIVQMYVRDEVSSVITYDKVLRGFERIHLKAGETKTIKLELDLNELGIRNENMDLVMEPGWFTVWIGASSEDLRLTDRFEVER
ncbi:MAG: glycoside hydrolase family 3 N-terminal domain-containing protein [Leadbetterella sp.]